MAAYAIDLSRTAMQTYGDWRPSGLPVRKDVLETWAAGLVVAGVALVGFMLPIVV